MANHGYNTGLNLMVTLLKFPDPLFELFPKLRHDVAYAEHNGGIISNVLWLLGSVLG